MIILNDELKYNIFSYLEPYINYAPFLSNNTLKALEDTRHKHYNASSVEAKLKKIFGRTFFFDMLSDNYKNINRKTLACIINNIFRAVYAGRFDTNNFMDIHTIFSELKKFDNCNPIDDLYYEDTQPIYDPKSRIVMVGKSYCV